MTEHLEATGGLRQALEAAECEVARIAQELHDMDHCSECADAADALARRSEQMRAALAAAPKSDTRCDTETEWEYRLTSGGTVCRLGYDSEGEAREWLRWMSAPFRRDATLWRRRKAGEWEALPDD